MLRLATIDDIDFIAELERTMFPDHGVNEHAVRQVIEAGMVQVFAQAGYIITHWGSELVDILRVGVEPAHQGHGIGRLLLEDTLVNARLPVMLTVQISNRGARRLYSGLGFRPIGYMPQDASLIMRKG